MNQSKFKPDSTVEYNTFEINKNNDEPKETDKPDKLYYKLTPVPSRNALKILKNISIKFLSIQDPTINLCMN